MAEGLGFVMGVNLIIWLGIAFYLFMLVPFVFLSIFFFQCCITCFVKEVVFKCLF